MTKINVAIVDDNEKMVSLLDAILQTDKNIEVIGRGDDGVQALDIIKNQEPDVVLLDKAPVLAASWPQANSSRCRCP